MKDGTGELHGSRRMVVGAQAKTIAIMSMLALMAQEPALAQTSNERINSDYLTATAELYGVSEEMAVDRLAKEDNAARMERLVLDLNLASYAGSWIDGDSLKLNVAVSNINDLEVLRQLDVKAIVVKHSLEALNDELALSIAQIDADGGNVRKAYVDVISNAVVIGVGTDSLDAVKAILGDKARSGPVKVIARSTMGLVSSGSLRAGVGTRNLTWKAIDGLEHLCSVGASVVGGYVTAGHCGSTGNEIGDVNDDPLGDVIESTYNPYGTVRDVGFVDTVAGWTPQPQVYGYSNGIFSVSADWGGTLEYPIGATVCRFGQTSGGPHCGTIIQKNVTIRFGTWWYVTGLTVLSGSCSDDGDSGGPHVSGTGQIQGVNVGKLPYDLDDVCPTAAEETYFQPIKYAVAEFDVTVLSSHGSNVPNMNSVSCPDWGNSGMGTYVCFLNNVKTQGVTTFLWTTNTGHSSTADSLNGTCNSGQTVNVTLKATNPYGLQTKNYSFGCPMGPIQ